MKILLVVPYFYPAWAYGGPGKLVFDLYSEFIRQGHEVYVLTTDAYSKESRMPKHLRKKGVARSTITYAKNVSNWAAYHLNITLPISVIWRAPIAVAASDVVHIHDFYTVANIWICLWCWILRKSYVLSVHGCLEDERVKQRKIWKTVFLAFVGKRMLRQALACIASSENEKKAYLFHGVASSAVFWMGHGIRISEFETKKSRQVCRRRFGFAKDICVFTYVGRIHNVKGLDLLLEAIARTKAQNALFFIAGSDDGYLDTVQQLIRDHRLSDRVIVRGPISGHEKAELFMASDVFVYPSRSEGFSLGILEAAAAGLPLLITTGCHFPEIARFGGGVEVTITAGAIAKAITAFVGLPISKRTRMGRLAKAYVRKEYDMSRIASTYLLIYSREKV